MKELIIHFASYLIISTAKKNITPTVGKKNKYYGCKMGNKSCEKQIALEDEIA